MFPFFFRRENLWTVKGAAAAEIGGNKQGNARSPHLLSITASHGDLNLMSTHTLDSKLALCLNVRPHWRVS